MDIQVQDQDQIHDILAESKGSFLNKYILESTPLRVCCAFYIRHIRGTFLCF